MRTFVLLAACLLASSGNPIDSQENHLEDASHNYTEDTSPAVGDDYQSSNGDDTDTGTTEQPHSVDELPHSTEPVENTDNGNSGSGGTGSGEADTEHTHTSLVTSVSETQETGNGTEKTVDTSSTTIASDSTTATTVGYSAQGSTDLTTPADSDPDDCKNAAQKNHTFLLCSYVCGGDEMFTAPDNKTCYLNSSQTTLPPLVPVDRSDAQSNLKGICQNGQCIKKSLQSQ